MTGVFIWRAQYLLLGVLFPTISGFNKNIEGHLPELSILTGFLERFIKPYIKELQNASSPILKDRRNESEVEVLIAKKIKDLKPFLQDDDKINEIYDDNITLEGEDETTIIELLPKEKKSNLRQDVKQTEPFKTTLKKYKNLRRKIDKALNEEAVSNRTKKLITKTLDELTTQLLGSQCIWKSGQYADKVFRQDNNNGIKIFKELGDSWNKKWENLKKKYIYMFGSSKAFASKNKIIYFFEQFTEFFNFMQQEMKVLSDYYNVKCEVVNKTELLKHKGSDQIFDLREGHNNVFNKKLKAFNSKSSTFKENKVECPQFNVCSEELKKFMIDFYYALNDTTVSSLLNFAAMYERDVNVDTSQEKEAVVDLINTIGNKLEHKIRIIFKKETDKFQLDDKKDKQANINNLKGYIKSNIKRVKQQAMKLTNVKLTRLRDKLKQTVQDDIRVNLDVELGNLEKDVIGRICTVFEICNGIYETRKNIYDIGVNYPGNDNSVYVKVQLTLDDDLKDKLLFKGKRKYMYSFKTNKYTGVDLLSKHQYDMVYNRENKIVTKVNTDYKNDNVLRITRTSQAYDGSLTTFKINPNQILPYTTPLRLKLI